MKGAQLPLESPIVAFSGEHRFLSNFYEADIYYWDNQRFKSAEHAFQAQKCRPEDKESSRRIIHAKTPGEAKRLGRKVNLRADWEYFKLYAMLTIVRRKFDNRGLGDMLLATGNRELIEGNDWHDNFWGWCGCVEQCGGNLEVGPYPVPTNHLGKILMIVRNELRADQ